MSNLKHYRYAQDGSKFVLSIGNHQEIVEVLAAFCEENGILAGEVSGIGAVSKAVLRFMDPATKRYADHPFDEQMEIANLTGNISEKDGKVYLHLHASLGRRDCTMVGGHLASATINGACELIVTALQLKAGRHYDEETGLNLYTL